MAEEGLDVGYSSRITEARTTVRDLLLAKSPRDTDSPQYAETILGHTESVVECFNIMFGSLDRETRLAERWFDFFRLADNLQSDFYINSEVTCTLHDIGKANSGFQEAVHGSRGSQVIRHEHLSGLLLFQQPLQDAICGIDGIDFNIVVSAIISHHLKAAFREFAQGLEPDRTYFQIYADGLHDVFGVSTVLADIQETQVPDEHEMWCIDDEWYIRLREAVKETLHRFRRELRQNEDLHRLLLAVRSALIVVDTAGSALVRCVENAEEWLAIAFGENNQLGGLDIEQKIIRPRIYQITGGREELFSWTEYQNASEFFPERALLVAPCGSGKTLSAWRWVKGQLDEQPRSRAIFLYPTRATASEGFRDYVSWAPEADAALIHGTATYELERIFEDVIDDRQGKDFTTDDRLYALGYWPRRLFSATVDQFLGFMQNSYRSTCLLPMLSDSVVVIDEVHSFDCNLFSALKRFLNTFDIPVLCMTASITGERRKDLEECGLKVFPESMDLFPDLQTSSEAPRYEVKHIEGSEEAIGIASVAIEDKKKVLWVVNTVRRCQRHAMDARALCYHSRFKLADRHRHHEEVVNKFKSQEGPALAITTQVCEMSLDLDADVLITERAPITSLIQRMGRCNRKTSPDVSKPGKVYIYPEDEKPYSHDDLEGVDDFLEAVDGSQVSQVDLQNLLESYGPAKVEPELFAAFLENGPWAQKGAEDLRDIQDFTVPAILDVDVQRFLELRRCRESVDGLLLSVPRKLAKQDSRIGRFPWVAPASHYSDLFGFLDCPDEEKKIDD